MDYCIFVVTKCDRKNGLSGTTSILLSDFDGKINVV